MMLLVSRLSFGTEMRNSPQTEEIPMEEEKI